MKTVIAVLLVGLASAALGHVYARAQAPTRSVWRPELSRTCIAGQDWEKIRTNPLDGRVIGPSPDFEWCLSGHLLQAEFAKRLEGQTLQLSGTVYITRPLD